MMPIQPVTSAAETPASAAEPRSQILPLAAIAAGTVAPLVGYGGTVALVVRAGQTLGASPREIISMVSVLSIGAALLGAALTWRLRMPIVLAWSTPGAALIAASAGVASYPAALGAFAAAAALTIVTGMIPAVTASIERIPQSIASAMLAGILLPFCLGLFTAIHIDPLLALALLGTYIAVRLRHPQFALLTALLVGVVLVASRGGGGGSLSAGLFARPVPVAPVADWRAIVSLGIPLFLVTLVSQTVPGLVVMRAAGYRPPPRLMLITTGAATLILAPFGAHGINMAAIVAAICTGRDAHPDPGKRWVVGLVYAASWLLLGLFSAPMVAFFTALPKETIGALTGLALLAPLSSSVTAMTADADDRDAAILTFAATASGMTLFGIGSAFWGLAAGSLAFAAAHAVRQRAARGRKD